MQWSFSKIQMYLGCPQRFLRTYIRKEGKYSKNDSFAIGTGIHAFVEYYSLNPTATLAECEAVYTQSVDYKQLENMGSVKLYKPMVARYMKSKKLLLPRFTEKKFKLDCYGVTLNGIIDIVTADDKICDYKTASKPYSIVDVQESLQLSLYAAWFYQEYKRFPHRVGYQVILKDKSGVQELWDTRNLAQIDKAMLLVKKCNDEVNATEGFATKRGSKCGYCPFRNDCK